MMRVRYKIIIFIMAIFIGMLFVGDISINTDTKYMQLSAKEYQEAYTERNNLLAEISKLKHSNNEIKKKIEQYSSGGSESTKIIDDMNEEIQYNKMIIGLTSVKGEGIKMILSDGVDSMSQDQADNTWLLVKTLHDNDMMKIINELKLAGAEAISINGQRVIPNSEILCGWAFLRINGVKVPGPFTVEAIGDKDVLLSILERNDSYVKKLRNRGINVEITKEDELHISGYSGSEKYNNLK